MPRVPRQVKESVLARAAANIVVLPTPGSPTTSSAPLRPAYASPRRASMRASSCSRPNRTEELGGLPDATPAAPVRLLTGEASEGGRGVDINKDPKVTRACAHQSA